MSLVEERERTSRVVRVVAVAWWEGGVEAKGLGNEDPVTLSSRVLQFKSQSSLQAC